MVTQVHVPVLLNEAIQYLNVKPNGVYVDMTLGRAGHSKVILSQLTTDGMLIGIDQDDEAIAYSSDLLAGYGHNFEIVKANFRDVDKVLKDLGIYRVDGFLFDLGVSSPQFDEDYRGFSYNSDAQLDMRMDRSKNLDARYIVNNYSLKELIRVFKEYGEDKFSVKIAKEICKVREYKPINTTGELVEIIKSCKPARELMKKGHPAKQIFQALRIEVNDELGALKEALNKCTNFLKIGGRVVVISFQSLEDKIIKDSFKKLGVIEGNRLNFDTGKNEPNFKILTNKPVLPTAEEIVTNHRSQSAKLRALERLK